MSSLPDKRLVVLTRAGTANKSLASALAERSVSCEVVPMLGITGISPDERTTSLINDLDLFDDIVFVSQNAVRYAISPLDARWPQWPAALQWYAVGEATGQEAERLFRVRPQVPSTPTSEGLLALPAFQSPAGRRILIVRGRGGRELLATTLKTRGAEVELFECYERRPLVPGAETLLAIRASVEVWFVIHSVEALDALLAQWEWRAGDVLVAVSQRIAEVAQAQGIRNIVLAAGPYDNQVIDALESAPDWQ